jgi:RHS repeat-associated protein
MAQAAKATGPCDPPLTNSILCENSQPGAPPSEWDISGAGDPTIQGFATDISVNRGEPIHFKVRTDATVYRLDLYRLGYYGGLGARKVATLTPAVPLPQVQPACVNDATTGLFDCGNWAVSATWVVPKDAVSGLYLVKLIREDTGGASHIVFIVRDDGGNADLLFQTADATWVAYNPYGGRSLAVGPADGRAVKVSYNRPFATRASAPEAWLFAAEYPLLRWLERNGYHVSYLAGVDVVRRGKDLLGHKAFLSAGQDAYWSAEQRAHLEAARDAGIHLAFLGASAGLWKSHWEESADGSFTPYRTLVCFHETLAPTNVSPLPGVWTGTWRDPRGGPPLDAGRPEHALTGTRFRVPGPATYALTIPEPLGKLRFWRHTDLAALPPEGSAALHRSLLGPLWDEAPEDGAQPAGLIRLSATTLPVPQALLDAGASYGPASVTHSLSLHRHGSGALVFSAGTLGWAWGLDGMHDRGSTTKDIRVQQAAVNLLADMGVQPGSLQPDLVPAVASTDSTPPTSTVTAPRPGTPLLPGSRVKVTGTASDVGGGRVAGVEVSMDGGATWQRATGLEQWALLWTPDGPGPVTLLSRAVDDSGNLEIPIGRVSVTVGEVEHAKPFAPVGASPMAGPGGASPTTASASAAGPGLVAAYGFTEGGGNTLTDLSGNGHTGTLSGAVWTSAGKFGNALAFNGTDSWVTAADSDLLDLTTGMTLMAWVYPTTASGTRDILLKEGPSVDIYNLYARNWQGRPESNVYVSGTNRTAEGDPLPVNTWTHVAGTYDGATLRLFLNGIEVASTAVSGPIATSTGVLRIGGNSIWGEFFQGMIDEVRIYSRALSAAEILTDMSTPVEAAGSPPTAPSNLTATAVSSTQVVLAWTDTADNEAGFEIRWSIENDPQVFTATVGPNVLGTAVTGLQGATSYVFRIRAFNSGGVSADANPVTATTLPPPAQIPGLIAAYSFNEGTGNVAADLSGHNHTGTLSGATWTGAGKFGGALSFDGVNDWVTVADSDLLDLTTGMTLMAWVNPTAMGAGLWRNVLIKERPGGEIYNLYANVDTDVPTVYVVSSADPGLPLDVRGPTALPLETWTHLAATFDGSHLRLYVDGIEVGSRLLPGPLLTSEGVLRIGGNSIWGEFFQGRIDEVRVYNRPLTQSEIQGDMATPIYDAGPPETTITGAPPAQSSSAEAAFSFTASTPGSGFECQLDGAAVASCASPTSYIGLTSGPHAFAVRAVDPQGQADPTPATYSWTVTLTPPPTLTSFTPTSGQVGTSVTLTGTNLNGATGVTFNGTPAAFTVVSSTQVGTTVPAGAATGPIAVTTPGGTATSAGSFTVVVPPTLTGLAISPQNPTKTIGRTLQFTATGTYNDGSSQDLTGAVAWSSSNPVVATITSPGGLATALAEGTTTITATHPSGPTAQTTLTGTILPPDPVTVAPALRQTTATPLGPSTEFLYTGPDPIQTGVTPGAIQATRAAVLRGRVLSRDGAPLSGVTVSILSHPEYGTTLSRTDGMFDLAVNGGSQLVVRYEKAGYLPVQRPITPPWQDYAGLPDVVLIPFDAQVTAIDLSAPTPIQVARGNPVTDSDGTRRATLLFPQGTTADLLLPGGGTQPLTTLSVRATEYTVGPNGPNAMPAPLPPTSTYTYAVELSVDEAVTAGAQRVRFSAPVVQYTENFLNFPVGGVVPAGYYDRDQAAWIPADNGRVIKLLSVTGGLADLDISGSGTPATPSALAALGITDAERQHLAALYALGQSLWRVPIPHFSPWDFNWPSVPPADATAPSQTTVKAATPTSHSQCRTGSVIDCENQVLRESVPLVGTPFRLHYSSDRVPGRKGGVLDVPVSGPTVPASLQRIVLEFHVGGRILTATLPPQPNQTYPFTWDGQDPYGRALAGEYPLTIRIGYVYLATFATPSTVGRAFGQSSFATLPGIRGRVEITLWQEQRTRVGAGWDARAQGIGGWTLDAHHAYDHGSQTLLLGTGDRYSSRDVGQVINSLTTGAFWGLTVDGQGNVWFTSGHQIKKRAPDGTVTLVAGTGVQGYSGDGGPAINARLNSPYGMDVDGQGNLYFADYGNNRIRKVSPAGIITTVAGNGAYGFSGDGGPATSAMLAIPHGVTVDGQGTLFIADTDNSRVRKVSPDGIIRTIAGIGTQQYCGDGGPATSACVGWPDKVAVDPQGNVFIPDFLNHRIRQVTPDGIIRTVAGVGPFGNGAGGYAGDGGPATGAQFNGPLAVALDAAGNLYIPDYFNHRVRKLSPDGIITTVAGNGTAGFSGDAGPATGAQLNFPRAAAVDAAGRLYLADGNNGRIRKLTPAFPAFTDQALTLPSRDGTELYGFDESGRHLRTLHVLTGAVRTSFGYDPNGRLTTVTDGDGNVTTIERDGAGHPTALVAPDGQRTTLTVDANGFLAAITNPAGEMTGLVSSAEGLLATLTDPKQQSHAFTYDARGHLTRDEDPAQGVTVLDRTDTATSFTVTRTTALQRVETFQVDDLADGGTRRVTTDPSGLLTERVRTPAGIETLTAPDGTLTTLTERADPRFGMQAPLPGTLSVRTPSGLTATLTATRALTLSDPNNVFSFSTITDTVTLNGRTATSTYTAATKTLTDTSPANRQVTSTLDPQGRILTTQVTGLEPITFAYDPRGRLSTMTQGTGGTARISTFAYNPQGFLETLTDPLNRTVGFTYDSAGRVRTQTLPDGRVIQTTYDANGNVASITPPSRPAHAFTYTPVDLEATYTPPDLGIGTVTTTYTYNQDRQLTQVLRPDGQSVTLDYEPTGGRLTTLTNSRGPTSFTYHLTSGQVTGIAAPGGVTLGYTYDGSLLTGTTWTGPVAGSVTRTYDTDFRVASDQVNGANPVAFQYDQDSLLTGAGVLTLTRHPQHGLLTGTTLGSVTDSFSYSSFGDLSTYQASYGGSPLINAQYTRDSLGRITQKVETIGGVTDTYTYGYDLAGRLIDVTKNGTSAAHYEYDGNSNRLSFTRPGTGTVSGSYDAQDRLTTYGAVSYIYTANGDLQTATSGGQTTTYSYDVFGNLTAVALPSGTNLEYVIDGQNRRIGKKVNGVLTQGILYSSQLRPVAELDGTGNLVSRFVYGTKVNVPEYMIKGGTTYRVLTDHLGSVRLVTDTATGAVAQRIDYDEFGQILQDTNPGFQPFGFAGGLYDQHTKLTRFGARDYDAFTGRWTTKDPIRFAGGDTNVYGHTLNDPINLIDPSGRILLNVGAAVAGGIIGAGIGALRAGIEGGDIGAAMLKGALIGAVAGGTLGAGASVLSAAGLTGLLAFDLSLIEQNIRQWKSGCTKSAGTTIRTAAGEGVATTVTTAVGGGLGRLAGDIGAGVSSSFGSFARQYFSAGLGAMSAMGLGTAGATP